MEVRTQGAARWTHGSLFERSGLSGQSRRNYRITTVYENPTGDKIDAMAGLFILYSLD